MANAIATKIEVVFEELWTKLLGHVKEDAVTDAQGLLASAKAQASALASGAVTDVEADAKVATGDAAQLASDAEGAMGSSVTEVPAGPTDGAAPAAL